MIQFNLKRIVYQDFYIFEIMVGDLSINKSQ